MNGEMEPSSEKCTFIFQLNIAPKMERKCLSKKSERTYFPPYKNPQVHNLLKTVAHK